MRGIAASNRVLAGLLLIALTACGVPSYGSSPRPLPPQPSSSPATSDPTAPPPAPGVPPSLIGVEWTTLPTTEKVVALTFDAGANADAVPSILRTLGELDVPATFFLTGRWVELHPDWARTIGGRYPVANHTYSHLYLTDVPDDRVRAEIVSAGRLILAGTGRDPAPVFRFPFGDSDARTIQLANGLGYGAIRWTVDTVGWRGTSGGETVDSVVGRVLTALQPGAIVLMHVGSNPEDGSTLDADALPGIVAGIRARGYSFVTVNRYL
jgi:peptidoglycan/xylan/chitin deacetylase (PgdA/CDA1 family)